MVRTLSAGVIMGAFALAATPAAATLTVVTPDFSNATPSYQSFDVRGVAPNVDPDYMSTALCGCSSSFTAFAFSATISGFVVRQAYRGPNIADSVFLALANSPSFNVPSNELVSSISYSFRVFDNGNPVLSTGSFAGADKIVFAVVLAQDGQLFLNLNQKDRNRILYDVENTNLSVSDFQFYDQQRFAINNTRQIDPTRPFNFGFGYIPRVSAGSSGQPLRYIDTLQFSGLSLSINSTRVTAPVPEPATWAMMIIGFGAMGSAMRLRRRPVNSAQSSELPALR